jgi:hypothetical protein
MVYLFLERLFLRHALIDDAFRLRHNDIGIVGLYFFQAFHLLTNDHRAAGRGHHRVAHDLEGTVIATGEHGQGKGVELVDELGIGIAGKVAGSCLYRNKGNLGATCRQLLRAAPGDIAALCFR